MEFLFSGLPPRSFEFLMVNSIRAKSTSRLRCYAVDGSELLSENEAVRTSLGRVLDAYKRFREIVRANLDAKKKDLSEERSFLVGAS